MNDESSNFSAFYLFPSILSFSILNFSLKRLLSIIFNYHTFELSSYFSFLLFISQTLNLRNYTQEKRWKWKKLHKLVSWIYYANWKWCSSLTSGLVNSYRLFVHIEQHLTHFKTHETHIFDKENDLGLSYERLTVLHPQLCYLASFISFIGANMDISSSRLWRKFNFLVQKSCRFPSSR